MNASSSTRKKNIKINNVIMLEGKAHLCFFTQNTTYI